MVEIAALLTELNAETADLDAMIAPLTDQQLLSATPAEGWDIATTITHLLRCDQAGLIALDDGDLLSTVEGVLTPSYLGSDLRGEWLAGAAALSRRLADLPPGVRIPWYGPPMSQVSFITARMMETWAHGQDVADALGVTRVATQRLRHICEIGFRTRGWSYVVRGLTAPVAEIHVSLKSPDGETWTWGPETAEQTVTGDAESFALLVTQRRHLDDLDLSATGAAAVEWLTVAQAFAGPPTVGRRPTSHL